MNNVKLPLSSRFDLIVFILLRLLVCNTVVPEKAADELFHENSHLEVFMSEIVMKNCAIRAEKSNPQ
ncbi:hypothetical protein F3Q47_05205 [Salmonella enterica subsp. enterica]|nr:hypothetical protein [Salmonella enterica subsp. enterica]